MSHPVAVMYLRKIAGLGEVDEVYIYHAILILKLCFLAKYGVLSMCPQDVLFYPCSFRNLSAAPVQS